MRLAQVSPPVPDFVFWRPGGVVLCAPRRGRRPAADRVAGVMMREAYVVRRGVLGPHHQDTLTSAHNLAAVLHNLVRPAAPAHFR